MKKLSLLQKGVSVRFVIDEVAFFLTPSTPEITLTDEQFEKVTDQLKTLPKDLVGVYDVLFTEQPQEEEEIVTEPKEDLGEQREDVTQEKSAVQTEDVAQKNTRPRTKKG